MKMRNKHRKPTALRCDAGSRCSLSFFVWSLVGCILMIHLFSLLKPKSYEREPQVRLNHLPVNRELEEVEEENIVFHSRSRRNPRSSKRKTKKPSLIDEFLDESSQIRQLFFPDWRNAMDPMKMAENDSMYFYPGRIWLDTDGNPIQAHGGGILYDKKSATFFWYGENKDGPTFQAHKKGAARRGPLWVLFLLLCLWACVGILVSTRFVLSSCDSFLDFYFSL
ncbi:hypothetical protein AMTRI_Chr12g271590 [Amborella trichopoda]